MAIVVNGEIYTVKWYAVCGSQLGMVTMDYRVDNVVGTPTDQQLVDGVGGVTAASTFHDLLSNNATYRGCGAQRQSPMPRTVEVYSTTGQGPGESVGTVLPKQCCGIMTKKTTFAGRRYRGRQFLPFPSEAANDPTTGVPTVAYITALDLWCGTMRTPISFGAAGNTGQIRPIIWHNTPGFTYTDVADCIPRPRWGTQRRRSDYGAQNVSPI